MSQNNYFKGLDTVRAFSLISVILVHMRFLGCGWIGIQTFFVLSGFLITGILLQLRDKHPISEYLKVFYIRRTLRIFPVYYLFLTLFVIAVAVGLLTPHGDIAQAKYAYLYVWNWYAISHAGPINHDFGHFWSLAVEEQFYLLWPLLVFLFRGRSFFYLALTLTLAGPLIRHLSIEYWIPMQFTVLPPTKTLYQMSTTYLDSFATGALLCYIYQQPRSYRFKAWHLALAAAATLLAGGLASGTFFAEGGPYDVPLNLGFPIYMEHNYQYLWGYSAINLLSAGLLLLVIQGRIGHVVFRNPVLMRLGLITYGGYIFHLPLLHYLAPYIHTFSQWLGNRELAIILVAPFFIALNYAIAAISYRFFELQFLRLKERFT